MSIRLRLTLWYTVLLGISLLLFGLIIYSLLGQTLRANLDNTLRGQAHKATTVIEQQIDLDQALRAGRTLLPTTIVFADQVYAQLVALPQGSVLQRSTSLDDRVLPFPDDVLQINVDGGAAFYTWQEGDVRVRIYSEPIRSANGRIIGAIQVAQSQVSLDVTLRAARLALGGGSLIALVLAAVVGAFLARTALRPIDEITRTARNITHQADLEARIHTPYAPHDEVGRLTTTFNEMLDRLQHLFEMRQHLLADVSHELRTPLTTIQGNLDLLKRGTIEAPQQREEVLRAIEGEVIRMGRLVADLLLLAQADAGVRFELKPVELDTVLLDVYRQAQVLATDTGVHIQLGHEDQAIVRGDADRLRQLLLNLAENGVKYTPPGGTVALSLFREDEWVRVSVQDTGVGIDPDDLPHIFDRFYRSKRHPVRGRSGSGTGLGLSIAKWVSETHGGRLTVTSQVGEGSTFTLWLPAMAWWKKKEEDAAATKSPRQRLLSKG